MASSILKALGIGTVAALAGVVAVLIGIVAIFLFAIFGALVGAVTGFIVSLTPYLGVWVREGFMAFGVQNPSLTAIGAALGFVAGFFRSSNSHSDSN